MLCAEKNLKLTMETVRYVLTNVELHEIRSCKNNGISKIASTELLREDIIVNSVERKSNQ